MSKAREYTGTVYAITWSGYIENRYEVAYVWSTNIPTAYAAFCSTRGRQTPFHIKSVEEHQANVILIEAEPPHAEQK